MKESEKSQIPNIFYLDKWDYLTQKPDLFSNIYLNTEWRDEYIKIFGKTIKCPRKVGWYSEGNVCYRYSGNKHNAPLWYPILEELKNAVENYTGYKFNFALLNYYQNGDDYMGWHSDDEKSLGEQPLIASVSLGASRLMRFKHKISQKTHNINLNDSSLLVMKENTQSDWLHSIPKSKRVNKPRINITFRLVY